jgi:hypothetical protein
MTKKENAAKLREIREALKRFPAEIRRQERAHREAAKIQKAFGTLRMKIVPEKANTRLKQGKKRPKN